jgi:hypothetical protein
MHQQTAEGETSMNLLEHSPDCAPLLPCAACELVSWLRNKLSPEDFSELTNRAQALAPAPKRPYRRRRTAQETTAGNSRPSAEQAL